MVRPVSNDPEFGGRYTASGIWIGPRKKAAPTQARTQAEAVARRAQSPTQAYLERYPTYVDANGQEQRNTWAGANNAARAMASYSSNPIAAPRSPGSPGGSSGGRGGGYGYGGGGGGGGGISAAAAAQAQIDALAAQLRSGMYTANAAPYDAMRKSVTDASAQDQAAASAAYNSLDTWLKQNNTNPYANVQLQRAQAAPDMNPYLQTQGVEGTNYQASNPEDGGYGAFQNVLALLGAGQQQANQSRMAESQMARTFSGQQIGAADNAYLANIAAQQAAQQTALDAEKRKALLDLTALTAQGGKMPDLASLGIYAPGGNAADPHGWAAIDAAMRAAGQR